jgi:tetratricopeptide (TPR) repeat protein
MLSLPLAFATTLETIPCTEPYLHPDEAHAAAWRTRLSAIHNQGPRIGLVWAGSPRSRFPVAAAVDRRRSISPDRLAPLFALPGLHFISLQKAGPAAPQHLPITDLMHEVADFADTAALIANLDLVISVDTAVAHLAAALGKPVWLLDRFDPDWRWLTGRRDSPWYPTLRLFRQPEPGDWNTVIEAVRDELRAFAPSPGLQAIFADAVRHHQAGHLTRAESAYREVLAVTPHHPDSLHLLGVIAGQTGNPGRAIELIRQAIAINPKAAPYHANLGVTLRQQNRHSEAVACFRAARDLNPNDREAQKNLDIALQEQRRHNETIE